MHHPKTGFSPLSITLLLATALLGFLACGDDTDDARFPSTVCCDPAAEPGTGNNPTCIEGVTCCADGSWRCNEGDGSSTCGSREDLCLAACDPALEPGTGSNPACIEGATCCPDGTWHCNFDDPVCP